MVYVLMSYYLQHWYFSEQEFLPGKIRLSIFLITEVVVGLPAVVWALHVLYHHHKSGSRVSVFMISLLLADLLVLLLNPYIVMKLLQNDFYWERNTTCHVLSSLCSASVIYGLHFQQVVALEGALSLRYPMHSSYVFFPSCSVIISIIFLICFFLCEVFSATTLILIGLPLPFIIILNLCIVTCKTPPRIRGTPYRSRRPSFTVVAFVTLTVILYVTFSSICVILWHFQIFYWDVFIMGVCLLSLNVIIDPLLCVLILRKHSELNKSELNI